MREWKTLESETVFQADPFVRVVKERIAVSQDLIVDDFYQVYLRPFVCCVPFLPNGRALMLKQYKHGAKKITFTFPGGFVEENERAEEACTRELIEETGFQAGDLITLGSFTDNGNQRGCKGTFFAATNCNYKRVANSGDLEETELLTLDQLEIDNLISTGEICISHHALAWLLARQLQCQEKSV